MFIHQDEENKLGCVQTLIGCMDLNTINKTLLLNILHIKIYNEKCEHYLNVGDILRDNDII